MSDTRQKCGECKGSGLDAWGETCFNCGGQGREPFREHGKEDDEDEPRDVVYAKGSNVVHADYCKCGACESYRQILRDEPH